MVSPVILWLRRDLRQPISPRCWPLWRRGPVVPVYVLDDEDPPPRDGRGEPLVAAPIR